MFQDNKGTALITGASSGIGAIYADRLAARGYNLIIVARNKDRLDRLAADISERTGRSVEVVAADLSSKPDLARVETILATDASITVLVNNAGIGAPVPTWQADVDLMEQMIDINVTALMRLAYAAVPGFVARGAGTIVNIASTVALAPEFLLNGVYGGTKAFVVALSASLQNELADKGVRVQVVLPGATATDFWDISGVPLAGVPTEIVMPAEAMVDAALAGLDLGETVTIPALPDRAGWDAFEHARIAMVPNFSKAEPARRYREALGSA
ncbi:SDR family oxidoreductase [Bosea sp. BIWAKO-01]|uniref:SDR family NAD(P)-dependent oxidoreductase n=1 Tax=Bosea sp. BIWAKO-01 TaxID=506668 RepID=UPI0008533256|nr:SDR family oxidoreductase [Bosea sp. BIWAKO-01]GAU86250.1 short-chain dehydrogenase [Bosea sp. BIWAKO-01]